jgi:hypothetical protein
MQRPFCNPERSEGSVVTVGEAKAFLISKIDQEASLHGVLLSDEDRKLLLFSVDEPSSARGIREDRLAGGDSGFEARVSGLLNSAYQSATTEERKRYDDAVRALGQGDHYLAVMANVRNIPTRQRTRSSVRDNILYVLIALAIAAIVIVFAIRSA